MNVPKKNLKKNSSFASKHKHQKNQTQAPKKQMLHSRRKRAIEKVATFSIDDEDDNWIEEISIVNNSREVRQRCMFHFFSKKTPQSFPAVFWWKLSALNLKRLRKNRAALHDSYVTSGIDSEDGNLTRRPEKVDRHPNPDVLHACRFWKYFGGKNMRGK